MFSKANRYRN